MKNYFIKQFMCICCVILLAGSLTGCSYDFGRKNNGGQTGYIFKKADCEIAIGSNIKSVTDKIGEPAGGIFDTESCVLGGREHFYYYDGFTITTFEKNGEQYIYAINIEDDTVKTPEGIGIGDRLSEVAKVYGMNFEAKNNTYIYTKGNMTLTFVFENDSTTIITYKMVS